MQTYYLDDLDDKMKDFFEFIDKAKKDEKTIIIVCCSGGDCSDFNVVKRRLKQLILDGYPLEIHMQFAASAAFNLCYDLREHVTINEDTDGMVHMSYMEIATYGNTIIDSRPTSRGRKEHYESKPQREHPYLTEKEKEEFNKGMDVYLNPDRIKAIFS